MTRLHIPRASLSSTSSSKSSSTSQSLEFSPISKKISPMRDVPSDLLSKCVQPVDTSIKNSKIPFNGKNNRQKYLVHKAPKPFSLHSISSNTSSSTSLSMSGSNPIKKVRLRI